MILSAYVCEICNTPYLLQNPAGQPRYFITAENKIFADDKFLQKFNLASTICPNCYNEIRVTALRQTQGVNDQQFLKALIAKMIFDKEVLPYLPKDIAGIDKFSLQELVLTARKLTPEDFESKDWEEFSKILNCAIMVLADRHTTQEIVDAHVDDLTRVMIFDKKEMKEPEELVEIEFPYSSENEAVYILDDSNTDFSVIITGIEAEIFTALYFNEELVDIGNYTVLRNELITQFVFPAETMIMYMSEDPNILSIEFGDQAIDIEFSIVDSRTIIVPTGDFYYTESTDNPIAISIDVPAGSIASEVNTWLPNSCYALMTDGSFIPATIEWNTYSFFIMYEETIEINGTISAGEFEIPTQINIVGIAGTVDTIYYADIDCLYELNFELIATTPIDEATALTLFPTTGYVKMDPLGPYPKATTVEFSGWSFNSYSDILSTINEAVGVATIPDFYGYTYTTSVFATLEIE